MKSLKYIVFFFPLLGLFACSKDKVEDVNDGSNGHNEIAKFTQSWVIPSDTNITPIAINHQSDILNVYRFGDKEFHFYHIFTNAQHQYRFGRFENDRWFNIHYSPNRLLLAASDKNIGEIVHSSPNSLQDLITTRFFDPVNESFSIFHSQIFDIKFRSVALVSTDSDFYMIAKRQTSGSSLLYKWNTNNQKWEVSIENIPESTEWNPDVYEIFRSRNGEFIFKNTNTTGMNFYEFKNNEFKRIYRGGYDEIILKRGARLHLYNNNYLLVFDKVYNIGTGNSLAEYYAPDEDLSILQSSLDGNKLILTVGTYNWSGTTYVHKIVVINLINGKVYELPAKVIYLNHDGWQMTNSYMVDKWQFRFNNDNKLEGLVHFEYNGPYGQTKLYRVVYPISLEN